MAKTVKTAFDEFLREYVNLDPSNSLGARNSRDWLINKIDAFQDDDDSFPHLHPSKKIFFGSFARKTKIRELDDIDIMICLKANGCTYLEYSDRIESGSSISFCLWTLRLSNPASLMNFRYSLISLAPDTHPTYISASF